jgi:hypothetical protein
MSGSSLAPTFERRHYIAVARVLGELRERFDEGGACRFGVECAADELARMFAADNPRFDNERFRCAAGVVGE